MSKARLWLAAGLIALTSRGAATAQDGEYVRSGDSFPDYFYVPGDSGGGGGFDISFATLDADKERAIRSGAGFGIAFLSDLDVFRLIRPRPGGSTGPDVTLGGTTSLRPFFGADLFRYETDKSINFNQPGGLDQILDNAYSGMLHAGLEAEVVVTQRVNVFGSVAGGVDLRWGNLVPNPQGFNPNQVQRNTPDPTEFDAGELFRAGGGVRVRLRGGMLGVGLYGQRIMTALATGERCPDTGLMIKIEWFPGQYNPDRTYSRREPLQIMNMPRIIIQEEEEELLGWREKRPRTDTATSYPAPTREPPPSPTTVGQRSWSSSRN